MLVFHQPPKSYTLKVPSGIISSADLPFSNQHHLHAVAALLGRLLFTMFANARPHGVVHCFFPLVRTSGKYSSRDSRHDDRPCTKLAFRQYQNIVGRLTHNFCCSLSCRSLVLSVRNVSIVDGSYDVNDVSDVRATPPLFWQRVVPDGTGGVWCCVIDILLLSFGTSFAQRTTVQVPVVPMLSTSIHETTEPGRLIWIKEVYNGTICTTATKRKLVVAVVDNDDGTFRRAAVVQCLLCEPAGGNANTTAHGGQRWSTDKN